MLNAGDYFIRYRLDSIRGFLIYVGYNYRVFNIYLKRVHLTIDGGRKGRDE